LSIIASISGIRGTIGGKPGEALTPLDLVKYAAAYGTWIAQQHPKNKRIVLGRDARISGEMVRHIVVGTLQSVGVSVIDIGLATTPTVEMAIPDEQAAGGIILSASHNPKQWNALKLLNNLGEFISDADGQAILQIIISNNFDFVSVDHLGSYETKTGYLDKHINKILSFAFS
jgi:phosphomannomutase